MQRGHERVLSSPQYGVWIEASQYGLNYEYYSQPAYASTHSPARTRLLLLLLPALVLLGLFGDRGAQQLERVGHRWRLELENDGIILRPSNPTACERAAVSRHTWSTHPPRVWSVGRVSRWLQLVEATGGGNRWRRVATLRERGAGMDGWRG